MNELTDKLINKQLNNGTKEPENITPSSTLSDDSESIKTEKSSITRHKQTVSAIDLNQNHEFSIS